MSDALLLGVAQALPLIGFAVGALAVLWWVK
jgi:hypothetical protein